MIFHVYSKQNCSWCVKAKALLKNKGFQYRELELGTDYTKDDLLSWFPHARTLPQIEVYFDGEPTPTYIGGHDDLVKYLETKNGTSDS